MFSEIENYPRTRFHPDRAGSITRSFTIVTSLQRVVKISRTTFDLAYYFENVENETRQDIKPSNILDGKFFVSISTHRWRLENYPRLHRLLSNFDRAGSITRVSTHCHISAASRKNLENHFWSGLLFWKCRKWNEARYKTVKYSWWKYQDEDSLLEAIICFKIHRGHSSRIFCSRQLWIVDALSKVIVAMGTIVWLLAGKNKRYWRRVGNWSRTCLTRVAIIRAIKLKIKTKGYEFIRNVFKRLSISHIVDILDILWVVWWLLLRLFFF